MARYIKKIEDYRDSLPYPTAAVKHYDHIDQLRNQWLPLQPNQFGRPLTHPEMDYNLAYIRDTLQGYRIMGSGDNGEPTLNDLTKSLVFHQITEEDTDFSKWQSMGYAAGHWIWIYDCCAEVPEITSCSDFLVVANVTNPDWECGTLGTGSIQLRVSGGTQGAQPAPYVVQLALASNSNVTFTATSTTMDGDTFVLTYEGLDPNNYQFTAIDFRTPDNCIISRNVALTAPVDPCLSFDFTLSGQNATEAGGDGQLTVSGFNGVAPYNVTITGPSSFSHTDTINDNLESLILNSLEAGTYTVLVEEQDITINSNSNCCSKSKSITLSQATDPCEGYAMTQISSSDESNPAT